MTYLVEDTMYGGEFVLKRIKNVAAVQRYAKAEFNALKDLSHPHLPRIYDVRQPQDDFHLKLEYIPGSELTYCMDQFRHRPDRILHLADALLDALGYLEDHGISHRDIAPKNIIVPDEDQGRTCLIDFGLAKFREDMRQSAVGTPLYRDPQVESKGWTNTSDLYSVAVVLYESLTGQLPFVYEDGIPKKSVPRPLPVDEEAACGSALLACLRRAAGLDGERYPSASAFLSALKDAAITPEPPATVEGTEVNSGVGSPTARPVSKQRDGQCRQPRLGQRLCQRHLCTHPAGPQSFARHRRRKAATRIPHRKPGRRQNGVSRKGSRRTETGGGCLDHRRSLRLDLGRGRSPLRSNL